MTINNNQNIISLFSFLDRLNKKITKELNSQGYKECLCGKEKVFDSHLKPYLIIRQIRSFTTDNPDSSLHSDGLNTDELYQTDTLKSFANDFLDELEQFRVNLRKVIFQNTDDFELFIETKTKKLEEFVSKLYNILSQPS
jgi:hypothetical protein